MADIFLKLGSKRIGVGGFTCSCCGGRHRTWRGYAARSRYARLMRKKAVRVARKQLRGITQEQVESSEAQAA